MTRAVRNDYEHTSPLFGRKYRTMIFLKKDLLLQRMFEQVNMPARFSRRLLLDTVMTHGLSRITEYVLFFFFQLSLEKS
jgi:hypothetical protein